MSFSYKPLWKLLIDKEMGFLNQLWTKWDAANKYQWILLTAYATTLNVV